MQGQKCKKTYKKAKQQEEESEGKPTILLFKQEHLVFINEWMNEWMIEWVSDWGDKTEEYK